MNLLEEGFPFYRISIRVGEKGGFGGVFWESYHGAFNVANYSHFTCKVRGITESDGRLQLKFETKRGWPVHYFPFPVTSWREIEPVRLADLGEADWDRLERITVAADDRDLDILKEHALDIADFHFFRLNE